MTGKPLPVSSSIKSLHSVPATRLRNEPLINMVSSILFLMLKLKPGGRIGDPDEEIIRLYHAHGECEQFHSEVKTDMDLERLPSGKFATNALILELGMLAYNILRMIGQGTIGGRAPRQKRDVKRRRLRTVISNLIMMAGHVTMHARQLIIGLGKSNVWRHIFSDICQKYAVTNA